MKKETVRDTYNKIHRMRMPIEKIKRESMVGTKLSKIDWIEISRQANIYAIKNTWRIHNKGMK